MNTYLAFFLFIGSVTVSWTAPTLNEDGSPLTDLAGFNIYYGTSSGAYTNSVNVDNPAATSLVIEDLSAGDYFFAATAYNEGGIESKYSGEAVKTVEDGGPSPPTDLIVVNDIYAYGVSQSEDVLELYPIGTVPLGTACLPDTTVNGKYRVPRDVVEYIGTIRPPVVFAECISSGN
jgi:hypothetical protein